MASRKAGISNPKLPRFPKIVNSKTQVFESGGAWPFDSLLQDGPTQPQGTAMEPQFAYDYESLPRDPIRRHSRPLGRCEGTFWRPFNPKDTGRYCLLYTSDAADE